MKSRWDAEMLRLQRRIGFQRLAYWYGGGIWAFLFVPCYMKLIIAFLLTVFPPESFCVGPQVPSVAVYGTKDKQSECRLGSVILLHPTSSCSIIALYFPQTFSLINRFVIARLWQTKTRFICLTAEVFDVETNARVNDTYNNMQMPKVENKTIVIDDYSTCPCSCDTVTLQPVIKILIKLLSVAALTMQILKPAGFVETAHYPLLLLVWVWIYICF